MDSATKGEREEARNRREIEDGVWDRPSVHGPEGVVPDTVGVQEAGTDDHEVRGAGVGTVPGMQRQVGSEALLCEWAPQVQVTQSSTLRKEGVRRERGTVLQGRAPWGKGGSGDA